MTDREVQRMAWLAAVREVRTETSRLLASLDQTLARSRDLISELRARRTERQNALPQDHGKARG